MESSMFGKLMMNKEFSNSNKINMLQRDSLNLIDVKQSLG
jgi:hypothetical protein